MSTTFVDAEVAELLRESPDLLAIADAVGATQRPEARPTRSARWLVAAAVVALAAAAALVSPWQGPNGGLVEQALAALGSGEVIHVVSVSEVPGRSVLDLETGAETPVQSRTEIWFDQGRALRRTLVRTGGQITTDELQTPEGAWTPGGRVYTCAWIAAHPVEATKARVSCSPSGENGTTPRRVAEPRPTLEPALAGFVSGYRDALADGTARRDGAGVEEGRPVTWLRFETTPTLQRVAVDNETLRPLVVETLLDGRRIDRQRMLTVRTIAAGVADFSRPQPATPTQPVATRGQDRPLGRAELPAALEGRALWAGPAIQGLPLRELAVREITTSYGSGSELAPTHSGGLELVYGGEPQTLDEYVVLKQSLQPQMLYGFVGAFAEPPAEGGMLVSSSELSTAGEPGSPARPVGTIWQGQLVKAGVYVTIDARSKPLLVEAARALTREGLE